RQDIRRELRAGKAEKAKYEHAPGETEAKPSESRARTRRLMPCAPTIREENARPWNEPDKQKRNEIPDRTDAPVLCGQVPVQMLVDEKETREVGVRNRYRDEPWRGDRQK